MRRQLFVFALATVSLTVGLLAGSQQTPPIGFFITSVGSGDGANLGGLAGADKHCQTLADGAGSRGRVWRAYLSASPWLVT